MKKLIDVFYCGLFSPQTLDRYQMEDSATPTSKRQRGLTGMRNYGSTCFINSALQCLAHTMDFSIYMLDQPFADRLDSSRQETAVLSQWVACLHEMWNYAEVSESRDLIRALFQLSNRGGYDLRSNSHCDSHEFMLYFIDVLHMALSTKANIEVRGTPVTPRDHRLAEAFKTWKTIYGSHHSHIIELFHGQFVSTRKGVCGHSSHSYDPFGSIQLQIPKSEATITLQQCLTQFVSPEMMTDPKNLWNCETCKQKVSSQKTFRFWKFPPIMIVSLKRFTSRQARINTPIDLGASVDTLDMRSYCDPERHVTTDEPIYELISFTNHYGNYNGGHCTAVCRNIDGKWYEYNDTRVQKVDSLNSYEQSVYTMIFQLK